MFATNKVALTLVALVFTAAQVWAKPNILALGSQCNSLHKQNACDELVKIALGDKDANLRREAMANLWDQSSLAKIVTEATDAAVRATAAGRLTDQSLLAKAATGDSNAGVRKAVVAKLTDQSLLAKIATSDSDAGVREAAVAKLTDQSLLAKIATSDSDATVRRVVVEKVADQSLLAKIATEDSDAGVRSAAQSKLDAAIAKLEGRDWDAAVDPFSITNLQTFLQKYPRGAHALMARQMIDDEQVINQIAASGPGSRFVLPTDSIPPFISKSIDVNTDRGRTIIDATNHSARSVFGKTIMGQINATGITNPNQITMTMNPLMPCGDSSVFVVSGAADNIQGDAADPIRLVYLKQYGVVVLGGQGKVFAIRNRALGDVIFQTPSR
jgi:hypothetical protein